MYHITEFRQEAEILNGDPGRPFKPDEKMKRDEFVHASKSELNRQEFAALLYSLLVPIAD